MARARLIAQKNVQYQLLCHTLEICGLEETNRFFAIRDIVVSKLGLGCFPKYL
jgi:hypothetical protein